MLAWLADEAYALLVAGCAWLYGLAASFLAVLAAWFGSTVSMVLGWVWRQAEALLSHLVGLAGSYGVAVNPYALKTPLAGIQTAMSSVGWIIPVNGMVAVFVASTVAVSLIRATRWALSLVPFLNAG